ncbi:MAG: gliding motility protein GldL, partial [Muribaculaceae bacterium]|nr:gliding motility protein GldL [Muribaculaceae bacterium]
DSIARMAAASEQLSQMAELATATQDYLSQISGIASQMAQLQETTRQLNEVSSVLLDSYRAITVNSETITRSSTGYVDQMENLNRNISGLNTIYEIQLRGISSQLESIDRVNRGLKDIRDMYEKSADESSRYCEETEKMARYMRQLNQVYEKMITAMTVNMAAPMMGGMAGANPFVTDRDTDRDTER